MNIIEYVKQLSNDKVNFENEVDALALAMVSYFSFEEYFNKNILPIKLKDIHIGFDLNTITNPLIREHVDLLLSLIASPKFNEITLIDFDFSFDIENEKQFAAMSFQYDETIFVSLRGTDFSVVGWKEDFNMSYSAEIPAQIETVQYLNRLIEQYPQFLIIAGHSKGGNLAVYGSANCSDPDRILKVFNFDGPGFRQEILQTQQYKNILPKVTKIIPRASFIGYLMDTEEQEKIIDSNNISFFQHNAFEWKIEDDHFIELEQASESMMYLNNKLSTWFESISDEDRKHFVDEFYAQFQKLNITSVEDVNKFINVDTFKNVWALQKEMDPETKKFFDNLLWQFIGQLLDFRN